MCVLQRSTFFFPGFYTDCRLPTSLAVARACRKKNL